jgi:hypothetical protein
MTEDHVKSAGVFTRKKAFIVIALMLPIFFFFAWLGDPGRGRAAFISGSMYACIVVITWDLKQHAWYFPTLFILLLANIFVVMHFSWSDASFPGRTLMPVGVADILISYGAIKLVEKLAKFCQPNASSPSDAARSKD